MASGSPLRTIFSNPVNKPIMHLSDVACSHRDHDVVGPQPVAQAGHDFLGGVQRGHCAAGCADCRSEVGRANLARRGGGSRARKTSATSTMSALCRLAASSSSKAAVREA